MLVQNPRPHEERISLNNKWIRIIDAHSTRKYVGKAVKTTRIRIASICVHTHCFVASHFG